MTDKYIEKVVENIRDHINNGKYSLASKRFYDLARYGVVIENRLLILLSSELVDVFGNSVRDDKDFKKEVDKSKLDEIIASTTSLLNFFLFEEKNLKPEEKQEILDLLISTISNSETIQEEMSDIFRKSRIIKYSGTEIL